MARSAVARLRGYQTDGIADIMLNYALGFRRIVYVLPTAAGKTVMFVRLARVWPEEVIIMAHRRELIRQASQKLGATPHGIIAPGFPRTRHRIQVASVQTLARRSISRVGLIIPDECHHSCATTWRNFFDSQPDSLIAGFTATPERLDGRGLGDVYDKMIVGPEIPEFVLAGYLKPTRIFAPPINVDLSAVHTLGGDYSAGELAEIMDKPGLTGSAVEHYGRLTPGQPAVVFCATVAAAEHEAEGFRAAGWRSEAVHGGLSSDERDRRIGGLETGDVQVLAACDLISEGLDIPAISVVILRRPTKSLARYKQDLGRGMRPGPGAPWLTVLDHAGNLRQHGMPDAYHEWTLDGRPRKKNAASEAPAVRICPECYRAHEPAPACPECGHLYEVARRKVIGPRQHDGELIEVKSVAPVTKAVLREAKTWEDVEAIRIRHGYKEGWTDQVMRFRSRRRITTTSAAEDFGITMQRPDLEALAAE